MKGIANPGSKLEKKKTKTNAKPKPKPKSNSNTNSSSNLSTSTSQTSSQNASQNSSQNVTPRTKIRSVSSSNDFDDNYRNFELLINKSYKWTIEDKSKKCSVIVWLDKIDNDSCLLTIFPNAQESGFFNFPISTPVSRFPTKDANPPFKLSSFGISDCDYYLNYKK